MNCQKCGAEIAEGSRFCEVCGTPVESGLNPIPNPERNFQSGDDNGDYDTGVRFNTKKIRKWFTGRRMFVPVLLIIIGILTLPVGLIFLAIGIAGCIMALRTAASVAEVDQAWNTYIDILTKRGLRKLDLIQEQVDIIDPVILVGFGEDPDVTFEGAKEVIRGLKLRKRLISLIVSLFKKNGTELDPYVAERIGKDDILRSLLISVSVYMFSEEQVLIYTGNLDISTGLIYKERTEEVFYKDIEGIRFGQNVFKVYSMRKKKFVNKAREVVTLFLSGIQLHVSYRTDMNNSKLQEQFAAMRNLIRDKKNV